MIQETITKLHAVFSKKTWQRVALAFALTIVPVLVFVELAEEVAEQDTLVFDETVLRAINSQESPLLDTISIIATQFAGFIGITILVVLIAALLWKHGARAKSIFLIVSVAGAGVLNALLKAFYQRDRPELWQRLVTENSFSFPSGHAMASSALALSMVVIFWRTRYRWPVVVLALLYMVTIAFTRLYLGVHYPTDIVAGWIVSGMWVAAVTTAIYYRRIIFRIRRTTKS